MISILFRKHFLFYYTFIFTTSIFCQKSITDTNILTKFNKTLKLYSDKSYLNARTNFIALKDNPETSLVIKTNATYYEAMCAIKLNEVDADKKVLNFVDKYPNSNKINLAFYNVANYYFANRKVAYALKWYNKIDFDKISQENRNEINFKMGYSYLIADKFTLAKGHFIHLINNPKYGNDSRYYYGYIAYKLEDYGLAESTLKEIEDNETYRIEVSYYLLDINFKAGNFKRCLVIGKELIEDKKRDDLSEISKIIGESYFNLKKYEEAIPYLKNYEGKDGKWTNTDFYQLGYAYYKQNDLEKAINNFNKIIDQENAVSQNAYYHLAECYLKLDKKLEALNAFKTASEMNFDYEIKEDAALNYAKLSYDQGNPFMSVAEVLRAYLKKYPKSSAYDEISQLVISSYIYQQDYDGALNFLAKNKSKENLKTSQEISLYKGIQLFNDAKIEESIPFFTNSSKSLDISVSNKAKYWESEAFYRIDNYKKALNGFLTLKDKIDVTNKDFKLFNYNLGYSYFQLNNYAEAATFFEKYILNETEDGNTKDDALVRLGDSYFALKKYEKAIYSYNEVVQKFGLAADYAQYQIGMIYGFIGENSLKVDYLEKVITEHDASDLKDDALFQIAQSQISLKDEEKAIETYGRLLKNHPKSIFYPKVLVRRGLLFYKNNQSDESLEDFKKVAKNYPNSPEAFEAVANARNVYIDKENLDDYLKWVSSLKFINVTNSDIDNTTFEVAEKSYFESKDAEKIIKNLTNYTSRFPDGINKLKANYYSADVLFKIKAYKRAIPYYLAVIEDEQNEYSEEALLNLTQIYLKENEFNNALPYLDRLEQEAYQPKNIIYAQSNLMKGYFETEAYDFAIEYAKKILGKEKIGKDLILDAKVTIARASFKSEDLLSAEEFFSEVEQISTGEIKAEALYYNAYFKNKENQYVASNKVIQNLIANYSAYKFWAVSSYVIMGKNYYGLNDVYQATFVLENIVKNFKQFEKITEEAQTELIKIKEEESKKNESIVKPEVKN